MARWKKPTPEEVRVLRRQIAERAKNGSLRLPDALVDIRKSFGMTQERFASVMKMTRRQIADIERGAGNPTLETLEKIGKVFGFTVGFVLEAPPEERGNSAPATSDGLSGSVSGSTMPQRT